jgi:hypothetical protein
MKGWRVFVDADQDGVWDRNETNVLSNETGNYSLNLSAGSHVLRVVAKKGYSVTTPARGLCSITAKAGTAVGGKVFGVVK